MSITDEFERLISLDEKRAREFYKEKVFRLVVEDFRRRFPEEKLGFVDGPKLLIITVGLSWPPIALSLCYFKPEYVIAVTTERSKESLVIAREIARKMAWNGKLRAIEVRGDDPEKIYDALSKEFEDFSKFMKKWESKRFNVIVDMTGGKKVMSGAVMLFAEGLKNANKEVTVTVVYIDSKPIIIDGSMRLKGINKPLTENLILIRDPIIFYSDLKYKILKELMRTYNYKSVIEQVNGLIRTLPERYKSKFIIIKFLAESYLMAMYKDDYGRASSLLLEAQKRITTYNLTDSFRSELDLIQANRKVFSIIAEAQRKRAFGHEGALLIALDFFIKARRYESIEEISTAAILYYRIIELIQQYTFKKEYDIDTAQPKYDKLFRYVSNLEERFGKETREIYRRSLKLPATISLLNGTIILKILGNKLVENIDINQLKKAINVRNQVPREHGLGGIKKKSLKEIRKFAKKFILRAFELNPDLRYTIDEAITALKYAYEEPLVDLKNSS
ncbi:MAG: hypothetical protein ACP6IQ_10315 [Candidatus Njordarchaeia archaeon]